MKSDAERHHRRSIRLRGYDYTQAGAYFVTMCTHGHECLFGGIVNGEMVLNECGRIMQDEWLRSAEIRNEIELDAFVIMPNHIHGIVIIHYDDVGATGRVPVVGATGQSPLPNNEPPHGPAQRSLGSFIGGFKSGMTKCINESRGTPGAAVWQRNYFEHIIRDDDSMIRIRKYVMENPQRWEFDEENPLGIFGRR